MVMEKERYQVEKKEWVPKTRLGRDIKEGKITSFDEILRKGLKIMEPEIVDHFFPEIQTDFIMIGKSKGKFGGGKSRVYKTTQKKIREGARMKFSYMAIVGNGDGYVGIGKGSSRQSMAARDTSVKMAKLNMIKIVRACGSWECGCGKAHSIPFKVTGKSGSVRITLMPAPRGTGIVAHKESAKMIKIAGVADVWSQTKGQTRSRINLAYATFDALKKSSILVIPEEFAEKWGAK